MRKHVLAIVLYALIAIALTQPLALNFATHVVGDGSDDPALTWNLWWFKRAVLDLHVSPLISDAMFYPIGINLAFYTLTLLNDALSLPLQAAFGLVPAANLLLLSSFVLGGYGAFLLSAYVLKQVLPGPARGLALAAFGGGIVYAFSTNKALYASLGQFNIASSQWIPFYVLFVFQLRDALSAAPGRAWWRLPPPAVRAAALAALFLLLQAYAEFTFASFLVVFTALFALANWRQARMWLGLALTGTLFTLCFLPILVPMLQELATEGDIFVEGSGFAEAFSADLLGFVVPGRLHPLLGGLDAAFNFPYINFVFVGWLTLALAAIGVWIWRRSPSVRFWALYTLSFALIALGPQLRVDGAVIDLPLPFRIFQLLPFFKGNRYPSRYSVMITLGIAVLVALALAWIIRRMQARRGMRAAVVLPALAITLMLGEHWAILPLSDYRAPSFYQEIRDDPGDFTVLEIPLDWRNGFRITGTLDKVFMLSQFYQTIHAKPMLSGNTSRNPELKFQYFTEAPVINSLIALETGHDLDAATMDQDRRLAPDVMRFFNVRYIVVRPEAGDRVQPYLDAALPGLSLWREDGGVRVYRLAPLSVAANLSVTPGDAQARLNFAEGWGELGAPRVWAQRSETRLLLPPFPDGANLQMTLFSPGAQSLSVAINGQVIGAQPLRMGAGEYRVSVPRGVADRPVNDVRLTWGALWPVSAIPRTSGSTAPFIVAKSAGNEVGDFAHLWVDGVDYAPNARGYNVWYDGRVASFDTFSATADADAFAALLASDPSILAFAVRDEASRYLTGAIIDQLRRYGVRTDIGWRWSHAVVMMRARDGARIVNENASPIRPATASFGERISAPMAAGALEGFEWLASR
ncbi:MAG: hypothetical protein HZB53_12750 [Chloroflexi bacterium]|nr:hypothetical protein [Chloroflexota bacterium]